MSISQTDIPNEGHKKCSHRGIYYGHVRYKTRICENAFDRHDILSTSLTLFILNRITEIQWQLLSRVISPHRECDTLSIVCRWKQRLKGRQTLRLGLEIIIPNNYLVLST